MKLNISSTIAPLFVLLILLGSSLSAQDTFQYDSIKLKEHHQYVYDNYSLNAERPITGAISTLTNDYFNRGLVSDPLLLVQSKLAGVQIYNRGGEPNVQSLIRVRGLNGFSQEGRMPLFVIDGVVGSSLNTIDPNDIGSLSVLRDASSQAIYGMRGMNGVVLINTKSLNAQKDTFSINYNVQLASSSILENDAIFSADEFRQAGGFDLGASTNWMDEISRNALSQIHSLSFEGRSSGVNYRVSGNYRSVDGILNHSGFDRYNIRVGLNGQLLNDRLKFNVHGAYTTHERQLGFREAFRHAVAFNPTAPISGADVPFPFDENLFGGFYENLGLFDSFNPLAINSLNERTAEEQVVTTSALIRYDVFSSFNVNLRYSNQVEFQNRRTYFSTQSLFLGGAYSPIEEDKGQARLRDVESDFQLYEAFINFDKQLDDIRFGFTVGAAYNVGRVVENELDLLGFDEPDLLQEREIGAVENWIPRAMSFDSTFNEWNDLLESYFGSFNMIIKDHYTFHFNFRNEGSSKLGATNRWGLFTSAGTNLDLKGILKLASVKQFNLRAAYGTTGGLPFRGGLSKDRIEGVVIGLDFIFTDFAWVENPELSWEKKEELNLGLDFQKGMLSVRLDGYNKTLSDWIILGKTTDRFEDQFSNQGALNASGVDIDFNLTLKNTPETHFSTGFTFSIYRSEFDTIAGSPRIETGPGGPIQDPLIVSQNGQPLGTIYAPRFSGNVDPNGFPIFDDVNGDGALNTFPSGFDPEGDFENIGSGVPTFELAWNTLFQHKGWSVFAAFRGAFGHYLVNRTRQFHEFSQLPNVVYNQINSDLKVPGLRSSIYSSLWVEKADFFTLDNLTIAKSFQFGSRRKSEIRVSLTGQNLFVLSNYSGVDPEPALEDIGMGFFGQNLAFEAEASPFSVGVDRRGGYRPARTFVLGVGIRI